MQINGPHNFYDPVEQSTSCFKIAWKKYNKVSAENMKKKNLINTCSKIICLEDLAIH